VAWRIRCADPRDMPGISHGRRHTSPPPVLLSLVESAVALATSASHRTPAPDPYSDRPAARDASP